MRDENEPPDADRPYEPRRMPLPAKIAWLVTALVAVVAIVGMILVALS